MKGLAQVLALQVCSIALACSIAGAAGSDLPEPRLLAVQPSLPRPSDQVVIEGRQLIPLAPNVNCLYLAKGKIRDQMIAQGWVLEGRYGGGPPYTFAMCIPL